MIKALTIGVVMRMKRRKKEESGMGRGHQMRKCDRA